MKILHDMMLGFPLLVFFLIGGACGVVFVAPRIYSHRGIFQSPAPQPERTWKDEADLLDANVTVIPYDSRTVSQLREAALEKGREVFGPAAQLSIEAVGKLHTLPSGKVSSTVLVRRLSPEGAAHDRA